MKRILIVVGTRPNYIKITQFKKVALKSYPGKFDIKIVHTGQHFEKNMSDDFFDQLDIWPDFYLNIPQGHPVEQMAEIMLRLHKVLLQFDPSWVIVPGDVTSTVAAALCAHRSGFKVAHLESGLRSFDNSMPEEVNRILTDVISDLYFVTEPSGEFNLLNESKSPAKIKHVGNTMIDTLVAFQDQIEKDTIMSDIGIKPGGYILCTMHRPATVDNVSELEKFFRILQKVTEYFPVIFPIHPRTRKNLVQFNLEYLYSDNKRIMLIEPLDYFAFQNLISNASAVLTDSGGIQEETTYRKIPCITLRQNTERPVTITEGSNTLALFDEDHLIRLIGQIKNGNYKSGSIPHGWDGKATERVLKFLLADAQSS